MGLASLVGVILSAVFVFIKKFLTKAVILSFQLGFTATTITMFILFYGFVITTLVAVYNKINDFFQYMQSPSSGLVSCMYGMFDCAGLTPVFNVFITEVYSILMVILLFRLWRFTRMGLKIISDEMFKLGVLLGM